MPFASPHLKIKRWPYYNDLINLIKERYKDDYKIVIAPGPDEIIEAKKINRPIIPKVIILVIIPPMISACPIKFNLKKYDH